MAFNKIKTDTDLGKKVHEHLVSVGVETPVIDNGLSSTEKIDTKCSCTFFPKTGSVFILLYAICLSFNLFFH